MAVVSTRKYLQISDLCLTRKQLLSLSSLEAKRGRILRHDIATPMLFTEFRLTLVREKLKELQNAFDDGNRAEIKLSLRQINELLSDSARFPRAGLRLVDLLFPYEPMADHQEFISKPMGIVTIIGKIYPSLSLRISARSWRSLEILYPESILAAIIFEIVSNAAKHVGSDCDVLLAWRILKSKFECEVHDNGKRIVPELSPAFIPVSDVFSDTGMDKKGRYGVSIVNELVHHSGGKMLVKRSEQLGGTMVWLDFPITIYYKKGVIHDLRRGAAN